MELAGYMASALIGVSLGLIGGGGSILTVPVLVYLFRLDAFTATTYSLFVVGTTSVAGSVSYFRKGLVDLRTAMLFGMPSIAAVFFTRSYLLPLIPAHIFTSDDLILTRNMLLMLLFAMLMIMASLSMIKKQAGDEASAAGRKTLPLIILLQGTGVGAVTGMVGAGGGFLMIPALVNMLKLPMKKAVGTSLLIIAINSLTGFLFSPGKQPVQWAFLLGIAGIATGGIFAGSFLSGRIDGKALKPAFGWFVLIMGLYIIIREMFIP